MSQNNEPQIFYPPRTRELPVPGRDDLNEYFRRYREEFKVAFDGNHRTCYRCGWQGCDGYLESMGLQKLHADKGVKYWGRNWLIVVQVCRHCGAIEFFDIAAVDFDYTWPRSLLDPDPPEEIPFHYEVQRAERTTVEPNQAASAAAARSHSQDT